MKIRTIALLAVAALLLMGISCGYTGVAAPGANSEDGTGSGVLEAARQVVAAFEAKDGQRLAALVHPGKGVRFSPHAFVDAGSDRVFTGAKVREFWTDRKKYLWGYADGTGDPIELTPREYCERYVFDRDFSNPSSISIDSDRARGNTMNNAARVYPDGVRVEYYLEPRPGRGTPELDWAALRLVFEQVGRNWFLVAVIHDEWTT